LRDAGDFLKALALGADALYIAESALIAMTYSQWHKLPPGTGPNELFLYWGKHKDKLDVEVTAEALGHFIQASTQELALLTAAIGKTDIAHVNTDDMISLTEAMQRVSGVRPAWNE
jgi:glutamate synthase domain-containing protein 2